MQSPLEQFEILVVGFLGPIVLTNSSIYMLLVFFFLVFFIWVIFLEEKFFGTTLRSIFEMFFSFIEGIVLQQVGKNGLEHFPIFFTVFFFILGGNCLGLTPFGFTYTGHIVITLFMALSFNLSFFFFGLLVNGFGFFNLFVPSGAPKALLPLIIVIEIISYSLRSLSLSIRLFANMMAGHTLMFILGGFCLGFIKKVNSLLMFFPFFLTFVILLMVFALELGIAFLQAYVFTILLAIYLNDVFNVAH